MFGQLIVEQMRLAVGRFIGCNSRAQGRSVGASGCAFARRHVRLDRGCCSDVASALLTQWKQTTPCNRLYPQEGRAYSSLHGLQPPSPPLRHRRRRASCPAKHRWCCGCSGVARRRPCLLPGRGTPDFLTVPEPPASLIEMPAPVACRGRSRSASRRTRRLRPALLQSPTTHHSRNHIP